MTAGERRVILVRSRSLADALAEHHAGQRSAGSVAWFAARLRSSCDRATGRRRRHYDSAR